ncbi:MAG: ATP-binding protein [Planctomycetota bacterium]
MLWFSAKSRIAFGQVCLLSSIILLAIVLGIVPDRQQAVLEGRASLCEAVAIQASMLVGPRGAERLQSLLDAVVRRNDELLSVGLRRRDGRLVAAGGEHAGHWQPLSDERSLDRQIQVPIHSRGGEQRWGTLEFCFEPLHAEGAWALLENSWLRLILFVGALSGLLNYHYLGKMLQHLDPSKTVPARVRSALNRLAEGLLVIDRRGCVVLANDALAGNLGSTSDELLGNKVSSIEWIESDGRLAEGPFPWEIAQATGEAQLGVSIGLQTADRGRVRYIVNATPVLDQQGKSRGVFASFDDVTQLEETKIELETTKAEAEEANNAKSEFLARMSHEIRTPMNAILGFTDVLRRGFETTEHDRIDYLNTIHSSGKHLLHLINDILDLSKVEAGKLELERRECNALQLIAEVITVMRAKADEKSLELSLETPSPVPETIVTDPTRLRQIVTNLVGNAIKFTEQGGVRVTLRLADGEGAPLLAIDVADTGIGMSSDAQQRVFDPFSQADATVTRRFGGTGLGLSISKSFAEALGGAITVESEPGRGTTFTASIATGPIDNVPRVTAEEITARISPSAIGERNVVSLRGVSVLVTDDGEANRKLAGLVLRRAGASVDEACNGAEAIQRIEQGSFDIVLMDMQMPVMDGMTATGRLRDEGAELPIIALTADAMKGTEQRCLEAGFSGYLTKPIDTDLLLSTIADQLGIDATGNDASKSVQTEDLGESPRNQAFIASFSEWYARSGIEQIAAEALRMPGPEAEQIASVCQTLSEISSLHQAGTAHAEQGTDYDLRPEQAAGADVEPPILSTLPVEDDEMRQIVCGWTERLGEQLTAMQNAIDRSDAEETARLAHWLKGSAGTVGFSDFTEPAKRLEKHAKLAEMQQAAEELKVIVSLSQRISLPNTDTGLPL